MARPTVNILFNTSLNDVVCSNPAGDSNFVKLDSGDFITWRDSQQLGGDLLSGASYPAVIPVSGSLESSKMFLMDYSAGTYKQVSLAGTSEGSGGNNRYVCCSWFSAGTVTIPYLEAYDDNTHLTWESKPLGDGTPANSSFFAIATTNAVPGSATWSGTPLAGTDSRIALDTGALTGAKYLYWNMKQVLNDWMISWPTSEWYNADLIFSVHFTYA
jgi:hypothetical protein